MINQRPIFINAFSRGGSNILWNVFLTHPDVCSPIVETLDIFRIGRHGRWSGYRAALLTRQLRFFDQKNLGERQPISNSAARYIDQTLYDWKLKTLTDEEMRFKQEAELYTLKEVQNARLVAKNNNGLTFLSDRLLDIYPDATFFALVRHPLAIYESYKRRRFIRSANEFVDFYRRICERMLGDCERVPCYHIVRFEDIVGNFRSTMEQLYAQADLDIAQVQKVRFKAKSHFTADGSRESGYTVGQHHWLTFEEANHFLEDDINRYQISRLDEAERAQIQQALGPLMAQLGYGQEAAQCD